MRHCVKRKKRQSKKKENPLSLCCNFYIIYASTYVRTQVRRRIEDEISGGVE
jgi:hypothetical protein